LGVLKPVAFNPFTFSSVQWAKSTSPCL